MKTHRDKQQQQKPKDLRLLHRGETKVQRAEIKINILLEIWSKNLEEFSLL